VGVFFVRRMENLREKSPPARDAIPSPAPTPALIDLAEIALIQSY